VYLYLCMEQVSVCVCECGGDVSVESVVCVLRGAGRFENC